MTPEAEQWRRLVAEDASIRRVVVVRAAFTLATQFGPDGTVQISKSLIADYAGISVESVESAIRELSANGWLTVTYEAGETGQSQASTYTLVLPDPADVAASIPGAEHAAGSSRGDSDASGTMNRDPELDGEGGGRAYAAGDLDADA